MIFSKVEEVPLQPIINSGLYKLSIPHFLGQSARVDGSDEHIVHHFPVEAYIRTDEDLAKGIFARFVIYPSEQRPAGDRYAHLATILRRAYFTVLFIPDHPEVIKWIEYRSAHRSNIFQEDILEIKLEWDKKAACYRFVEQSKLDSIFD
jgi:hypothetical protein